MFDIKAYIFLLLEFIVFTSSRFHALTYFFSFQHAKKHLLSYSTIFLTLFKLFYFTHFMVDFH